MMQEKLKYGNIVIPNHSLQHLIAANFVRQPVTKNSSHAFKKCQCISGR
jgi:hypothetical protein